MKKYLFKTLICLALYPSFLSAEEYAGKECLTAFTSHKLEAFDICTESATNDKINSLKALGDMYYFGWFDKAKRDYTKALQYYKKSAVAGNIEAKYNVAVMYEKGQGTDINYNSALSWYLSSAKEGNVDAQYNLANMYSKGAGSPQNQMQASRWYLRAANQGEVNSQYNMGNRYFKGNGIGYDPVEGYKWYLIAESYGDGDAKRFRESITENIHPDMLARAKKLANNWKPKSEYSAD